ncbi:MAG: acyltransferase [Chitinophagaceae bacterium]|nr:acyltransferase [Chitinophagaceae bacterium]
MNSHGVPVQLSAPGNRSNGRLGWVDYARGIAILLVVYRHCLVGLRRAGVDVPGSLYAVQEFLYNVRMPVFFVLSGIFLTTSLRKSSTRTVAGKKAASLLYPYFIWSVFLISLQWLLSDYTNSSRSAKDYLYILLQPRELDHMWYLLALFNTTLLYLLLKPLLDNKPLLHTALAVALHFLSFYLGPWSFFSDIAYHYIFLVCGVLAADTVMQWESVSSGKALLYLLGLTPVFVAGQLFWLRTVGPEYQTENWWGLGPYLLIILIACLVYYLVSRLIQAWGYMKWLAEIGKHSLYIYILHIHVIAFVRIAFVKFAGNTNPLLILLVSLVTGILLPVLFYKVSRRFGWSFLFTAPKFRKA